MTEATQSGALGELDPLIGLTISGRYRVHTLLGQGGMGKVFQAQQIPLGRPVALKVLDARGLDREFHRRFFQEAAILAKLRSRHTVTIYDYGRDGDFYFIAMELVAGESLDRVLVTQGPLPVPRVLTIAEHVCRSLREAHTQGVIHRDLKPGNVMLTRNEEGEELAKVLDFGLAKRLDRSAPEDTQTDTVPGSPKYMAPEVVRQQPVDGRADMYGLGVMLYYMLTGVVPFDRDNPMDILVAHLQEAPRPLRVANPSVDVPEALEQVVMRCLAKTPDERFANMQELLAALRALAKSFGRPSRSSFPAVATASDHPISGMRAKQATPALHLEARDIAGPSQPVLRLPVSGTTRGVWIAGAFCALAIAGLVTWRAVRPEPAPDAKRAPASLAPVSPARPEPAAAPTPPNMVITPEEVANDALPRVTLRVSSNPPGASVLVHGKVLGTTPMRFEWRDAQAHKGAALVVQLKRDGYQPYTFKRTIETAELELSAELEPVQPAQPVQPEDDLRALEARARAFQAPSAPAEVLKITPSEPEPGAPAPAEQE